jgi:hypothetical protein
LGERRLEQLLQLFEERFELFDFLKNEFFGHVG